MLTKSTQRDLLIGKVNTLLKTFFTILFVFIGLSNCYSQPSNSVKITAKIAPNRPTSLNIPTTVPLSMAFDVFSLNLKIENVQLHATQAQNIQVIFPAQNGNSYVTSLAATTPSPILVAPNGCVNVPINPTISSQNWIFRPN
jgi:hypothetical protein